MADKPKVIKITTPVGVAVFPNLNTPDTKFKPEGEYTAKVRMPIERGQDLMNKLDEYTDAEFERVKAANGGKTFKIVKGKKKEIVRNDPYVLEVDDEGNPTGMVSFNAKMKAQYTDKKTKRLVKQKPKLFDAAGNPIDVPIWGGSEIKVAATLNIYDSEFGVGCGLRLRAVQVIKLRTSGGGDASAFGFDKEEGYESEASQAGFDSSEGDEESSSSDTTDDEF